MNRIESDVPFDDGFRFPRTLDEAFGYRAELSEVEPDVSPFEHRNVRIMSVVGAVVGILCVVVLLVKGFRQWVT